MQDLIIITIFESYRYFCYIRIIETYLSVKQHTKKISMKVLSIKLIIIAYIQ